METILVDVCHPAHAHFFRHPIARWRELGCTVHVAARDKDVALPLMREFGIECTTLGRTGKGAWSLLAELARRDVALYRLARRMDAQVITAIGGIFAAHAAWAARIPSVVFYDTEMATLQNRLTYPLASVVAVPRCYEGWTPRSRTARYAGYHELSYLHPERFAPDRERAIAAGLDPGLPTYLVRLVAWTANHDFGDSGLSPEMVLALVDRLGKHGHLVISSENPLPPELEALRFRGRVSDMHHLMAFSAGYFGESATMASECAVLGVPAVYAANSPRGYTNEQESRYGLVRNVRELRHDVLDAACDWLLAQAPDAIAQKRDMLLAETIDVAEYVAQAVRSAAATGRR
jgi:predicted glycosyltransferase